MGDTGRFIGSMAARDQSLEVRSAACSPFLESPPTELPVLQRVSYPRGAVAEFQQQMEYSQVDLPFDRMRIGGRRREWRPTMSCPPTFKAAYNAFCSARRLVFPRNMEEAQTMVSSETVELTAFVDKVKPIFDSLPPRSVGLSLVIPSGTEKSNAATLYLDAFAAMSDARTLDGRPIATMVRYSVYGGLYASEIARVYSRESHEQKEMVGVCLVMRWAEASSQGSVVVRTECSMIDMACCDYAKASEQLQLKVIMMAKAFGATIPSDFFLCVPPSRLYYFEDIVEACSSEIRGFLHIEEKFVPSQRLAESKKRLVKVPGCFVRLSPIAMQLEGVTASTALHAVLLCAEGSEHKALCFAKRFREGMPVPQGEDCEMHLHTAAVHTEQVCFNGMVSLYAPGGKPGEPIKNDGNWVYKTTAAIVTFEAVASNFFIMSCGFESLLPSNPSLYKFMHVHMEKAYKFSKDAFAHGQSSEPDSGRSSPPVLVSTMSSTERFELAALGVDLKSSRMFLGDALAYLTHMGTTSSLVEMLVSSSTSVGLRATLSEAFGACAECLDGMVKLKSTNEAEVCRLKRVADAALLIGCRKKARASAPSATQDKVRLLMKSMNIVPGKSYKADNFIDCPRCDTLCSAVCKAVCECYERGNVFKMKHSEQIALVIKSHVDFLYALYKSLALCCTLDGAQGGAFVLVHCGGNSPVSVVHASHTGDIEPCGIGRIFEQDEPRVLVAKLKSDRACLLTPLVSAK